MQKIEAGERKMYMFDAKVDTIFTINAISKQKAENSQGLLILKECNIYIFSEGRIYSEFEQLSFDDLNRNDYSCGAMEVEFVFNNDVIQKHYPDFYTKCFVIRTDNMDFIKPMKMNNNKCSSKVNKNGDLVIGIRYYFRDESEIEKIQSCKSLLIEGFIALDNPETVFGIMSQLNKEEMSWQITSSYTYKPRHVKNIKGLMD